MPTTFECFSGCRYVVEPVLYEGDLMGRVVFGPFVPEDLVELPAALRRISRRLRREARRGLPAEDPQGAGSPPPRRS